MKRAVCMLVVVLVGQLALGQATKPGDAETIEAAKKFTDQMLQRVQALNNLKQRYQFKLRDLQQDLRDKALKLAIDGMGVPGRLSAREVELTNFLKQQFELAASLADAKSQYEQAQKSKGKADLKTLERLDGDSRMLGYIQQIDEIDLKIAEGNLPEPEGKRLEKRKAALETKVQKRREEIVEMYHQARTEELAATVESTQKALARANDEVNNAKQDLGDLTYVMSQYQAAKDEEKSTRELLDRVTQLLDRLAVLSQVRDVQGEVNWQELDREMFMKGK